MQTHLLLIALLIAAYSYWHHAQQVKEIALAAVRRQCQLDDVQMLDDYIALNRCWFRRDRAGKIRILRRFTFEFSATGVDRYDGICIMQGCEVIKIELAAHRFPVQ